MLYLLAILLPPVAVFMVGRPVQGFLNLLLTLFLWLPGAIHAVLLVNEHKADKRMVKQVKLQHKLSKADKRDMERQFARQDKGDEY